MTTNEFLYGFINNNGILINSAVLVEGDSNTLQRIKEEYSAFEVHKMNLEKETPIPGETFWNGERFLPPRPFNSWVWIEEQNGWASPIPYPNNEKNYVWNEEILNWQEVSE